MPHFETKDWKIFIGDKYRSCKQKSNVQTDAAGLKTFVLNGF